MKKDLIRDPNLAHVMKGCDPVDHLHLLLIHSHLPGDGPSHSPDSPRVLPGFVIPELGSSGESREDLGMGFLELGRPKADPLLQVPVVFLESQMEKACFQEVLHTEPNLGGAQRFGEEVLGPGGEAAALGLRGMVGGQD